MPATVAIRFDVSSSIGSGHLRRAIALGDELSKRQISHLFVTPNESYASAIALGVPKNQLCRFDGRIGEMEWTQRIPELTHVITDICHHEQFNPTSVVEQILQSKQLAVAVIDSMPPNHFQGAKTTKSSIIVTPYLDAKNLRDTPHCKKWLAGVRYSILDSTYLTLRRSLDRSSLTSGDYILVCCGGSDPSQMSEYILSILLQNQVLNVNLKIVVGNLFGKSRINSLKNIEKQNNKFVSLVFNRNNIADLIHNCGVLIGFAGLIRYESACLGKPSFLVQNHSNFEQYLRNFHNSGLGNIFLIEYPSERNAFESTVKALGTVEGFAEMSKPNTIAFDQVDGRGSQRFLDIFLSSL